MMEVLVAFISFIALVLGWAFIPTREEQETTESVRSASAIG